MAMGEAQELLGVSNFTIWKMVKEGRLATFRSRVDRRKKLVRRADVEALLTPEPTHLPKRDPDQTKTVACQLRSPTRSPSTLLEQSRG